MGLVALLLVVVLVVSLSEYGLDSGTSYGYGGAGLGGVLLVGLLVLLLSGRL